MNEFLEPAVEIAREAGTILLSEFSRPVEISYKGEVDLVTGADKRSERAIVTFLRERFPPTRSWPKEGGGQEADSRYRWHVDPLDGTTNFAHGYPCFAVSIGLEEDGELIAGVIYQPVAQELFTAAKGEGAYLNGKPSRSPASNVSPPVCCYGVSQR
jgi:myo-inositol-1(or 4)-monophosphatase